MTQRPAQPARLLVAAATLVVAAVGPGPANAAAYRLALPNGRNRTVEIRLEAGAVIAADDVSVRTSGRYAVAVIEGAGHRVPMIVATVPYFGSGKAARIVLGPTRLSSSRATTYRIHLITDSSASAAVVVTNAAGDTPPKVVRRRQVAAFAKEIADSKGLPSDALPAERTASVPLGAAARTLALAFVRYQPNNLALPFGEIGICEAPDGADACPDEPETFGWGPVRPPQAMDIVLGPKRTTGDTALLVKYAGYSMPASLRVVLVAIHL